MKAIVIEEFSGVEDGGIHPRRIGAGEMITGELARVAIDNGWAREAGEKAKKPPDNKMLTGPARNKRGCASPPAPASRRKTARASDT